MAFAFDTLGYAKRLTGAGVERDHAEAHAEAARDFIMTELVTKSDIRDLESRMTIRFGAMLASAVAVLAVIVKLI